MTQVLGQCGRFRDDEAPVAIATGASSMPCCYFQRSEAGTKSRVREPV